MHKKKVSYAQNSEDILLERCFEDIAEGFYIDVGAAHPIKNSVTKYFYEKGWRGINIEPIPDFFKALESDRPLDINLNIAASDQTGTSTFYMVARGSLSTFDGVYAEQLGRERDVPVEPLDIPTRTLSSICKEYAQNRVIHFLKVDAEGWERHVLLGADFKEFRPQVIVVEATKPNTTEVCSDEWDSLLLENGYTEVHFDGINKFYVAGEASHLIERFQIPLSWHDGFISYERHLAETNLNRLSKALGELSNTVIEPLVELIRAENSVSATRLNGAVRELSQQMEMNNQIVHEQNQQLEELRGENLMLQSNIAELNSELRSEKEDESRRRTLVRELEDLLQSEIGPTTEALESSMKGFSRLLDGLRAESAERENELSTLRSENDALKKNIGILSEEVSTYRAHKKAHDRLIERLESSNRTLSELLRDQTQLIPDQIAIEPYHPKPETAQIRVPETSAVTSLSEGNNKRKVLLVCRAGDELINKGRARSIWAANVAAALNDLGFDCTLSGRCSAPPLKLEHPQGFDAIRRQIASTYGVRETFNLEITSPPRNVDDPIGDWEASNHYPDRLTDFDFVYCRDPRLTKLCAAMEVEFVYEDHNEDYHLSADASVFQALNSRHCKVIVAITPAVKNRLVENGANGNKIIVVDSGVNAQCFNDFSEAAASWRQFLLKNSYKHLIVYTGGLQKERGMNQIVEAAALMPDCLFLLAGGRKADQNAVREMVGSLSLNNIMLPGFLSRRVANEIQQAADALLLTREDSERKMITSPLKLFEYLASRRPIVSYPLPTVDVDARAHLPVFEYHPLNGIELSKSIKRLLEDNPFSEEHYKTGVSFALTREWSRRQKDIIEHAGLI